MPQENRAYQCDDDELLNQLMRQVFHCTINQFAAVVGGDDVHAAGQAGLELFKLGMHRRDGFPRILATAQNDHAADCLSFTIHLRNAAPYFGAELDIRHIAQQNRHAIHQLERDHLEIGN